jgi:catechol 2,3-dioxygenase-like lactoylglutathione lyase family enzyme
MTRGLDHVAHAVRDLNEAAAFYTRAGFKVGARNRHAPDWGTQNHIVQLLGFFIELLAMADLSAITQHAADFFSFGAFARDFLACREGLAMLVLEGRDPAAEATAFRAAGIGDFKLFDFERGATRADGTPNKVAFSLAFARDAKAPDVAYFACTQHYPENFWNSAFQEHPNTASGIAGVVQVADNPSEHRQFLSAFTGEGNVKTISGGIVLQTPRGAIEVIKPAAFVSRFGTAPPETSRGARLAALRLSVHDMATARAVLRAGRIDFTEPVQQLVIGPETGMGASLVFEAAG